MDIEHQIDGLNFSIEKSLRYHQRRRSHFEWCHTGSMFAVIVLGSAAFGGAFAHFNVAGIHMANVFGLIITMIAAADLVIGFSRKARDHEFLHREFGRLAIELRTAEVRTESELAQWTKRRIEIESDEPPIYWALEASCYNEVVVAWGRKHRGLVQLKRRQRVLMNWCRFEKDQIELKTPPSQLGNGSPPAGPVVASAA
jgi:hypothetical protein